MDRKVPLIWFLFLFIIQASFAEVTIFLKNGDRISGKWQGGNNQKIHLNVDNQHIHFQVTTIESIVFNSTDVSAIARRYLRNGDLFNQRGLIQEAKSLYQKALEE